MTTTTQLAGYRRRQRFEPTVNISLNTTFRELWADGLATVATVTLLSILILQLLPMLIP